MGNSLLAIASQFTHDAIAVFARDGRLLDGNDQLRQLYGYSPDELASLTIADFRSDAARSQWSGDWAGARPVEAAIYETEHRRKDGSVFPVDVSSRGVTIDGQEMLVMIFRDISEQVSARRRIERLKHLYEAVSTSNRAVISATDEDEMFTRICQACWEYGMRLAWVGMAQNGKIVPCAFAGDGGEYVTGIDINTAPGSPLSNGPTGAALITGSAVICNDFQNDPRTAPWHERGKRYGWRASAGFPLFKGSRTVGVLTLYSELLGYFGAEETRLLEELACDISFALDRFETDRQRQRLEEDLKASRLQVIRSLGRAGEYRDNETGAHILRMSHYCRVLADAAGLPAEVGDMLLLASPMHDVGKIGIPDAILLKPGKLEPHEFEIMKTHVRIGAEILSEPGDPLLEMARVVALTHHEKWDGSGYPHGLKGEDIPIEGRITAICDVYDALTSARPYKRAWSEEEAAAHLRAEAGRHFDPDLISHFLANLPSIQAIRKRLLDVEVVGAEV